MFIKPRTSRARKSGSVALGVTSVTNVTPGSAAIWDIRRVKRVSGNTRRLFKSSFCAFHMLLANHELGVNDDVVTPGIVVAAIKADFGT